MLLLLGGRTDEAFNVFQKVRDIAPPAETRYASEGFAKGHESQRWHYWSDECHGYLRSPQAVTG